MLPKQPSQHQPTEHGHMSITCWHANKAPANCSTDGSLAGSTNAPNASHHGGLFGQTSRTVCNQPKALWCDLLEDERQLPAACARPAAACAGGRTGKNVISRFQARFTSFPISLRVVVVIINRHQKWQLLSDCFVVWWFFWCCWQTLRRRRTSQWWVLLCC